MTTTATDTRWTVEVEGTFNPVTVRAGDAGSAVLAAVYRQFAGFEVGFPTPADGGAWSIPVRDRSDLIGVQVLRVEVSPFGFGEPSSVWSPAKVWDFDE